MPYFPIKLPAILKAKKSKVLVTVPYKLNSVESLIIDPLLMFMLLIAKVVVEEEAVKSTSLMPKFAFDC